MIDLKPEHRSEVLRILRLFGILGKVFVFGSRSRGDSKPWSDLDLWIENEVPLGIDRLGRLREAFQDSPLPMRVDLVDGKSASAAFREAVEKEWQSLEY